MSLEAAKSTLKLLLLFVYISIGFSQDDTNNFQLQNASISTSGSSFLPTTPTPTLEPTFTHHQRKLLLSQESCLVPPQPANGERKRHKNYCFIWAPYCELTEGSEHLPGTLLSYTCNPGYKLIGNPIVVCEGKGNWSPIPVCNEVKCDPLNSASTVVKCFRLGQWVSCNSSVLQGTRAKVSCSPGYLPAGSATTAETETVECNMDGKWEPEPIGCRPACGVAMNETATDFPWSASLYMRWPAGAVDFICLATIISNNLLLTTADCVYERKTNTTMDAGKLFVMLGNSFKEYDYPLHDPKLVWKSAVKAVHRNCDYNRQSWFGNIALIETKDPFEFSSLRLPVCLNGLSSTEETLQPGAYGSLSDYALTTLDGIPIYNNIRSITTLPYVPLDQCRNSTQLVASWELTSDKFCAGYSNGSSTACPHNIGGGLAFEQHGLWYLKGIVTLAPYYIFDKDVLGCDTYTMLTNVSAYSAWIEDITFNLKRHKSHPSCHPDRSAADMTTITEVPYNHRTPEIDDFPSCTAPPQPENGNWTFHQSLCSNDAECNILRGVPLRPGTQLIYGCADGYMAKGNTEVYCGFSGNWSAIPVCTEIKCESLNSVSTAASCFDRFGNWMSCDPNVSPGTRAEVSCHLGYKKDTAFSSFRRETVRCDDSGRWKPDPIRCVAVCGIATTHQTPFIINGTTAQLSDFPWHATLYMQKNSSTGIIKDFICGATIIHTNFVLTAAHCVYDERTETLTDARKLFIMTGNLFRDYDSPIHNPVSVKRTAVEKVYRPCTYYGLRGNYASDIALLELKTPFNFSGILSPACLDVEGYSDQILEPGASGKVAGFGRTETGVSSGILQTLTLPYISYNQCKTPKNAENNNVLISTDKFCAGYTNGSAVCEGDSGGGLVFRKSELYYVLGVVSVGLGVDLENGEKTCDRYAYSLYTKVSEHMTWIQDVMFQRAQRNIYPPCNADV